MLHEFFENNALKSEIFKKVFLLIQQKGPVSKAELTKETNLNISTLTRMLESFMDVDLIKESGIISNNGAGRPRILYEINPNYNYLIGLDISGTYTKVILLDLNLSILKKEMFLMTSIHTPELVLTKVVSIINKFMEELDFSLDKLLGIGIGAVGPIDYKKGIIIKADSFPAKGWENVRIIEFLKKEFPVRMLINSGANTAVFGEYYYLQKPKNNIVYFNNGMSLRCSAMINGLLINNVIGDTDSYGHITIDYKGKLCTCGRRGCLTNYISLGSLLEETKEKLKQGNNSTLLDWVQGDINKLSIDHVIEGMKNNDEVVKKIVLESAYYLGIGIANIVNALHPDKVIINSPLIVDGSEYLEKINGTARNYIHTNRKDKVIISQGNLKSDAASIGAAIAVFESIFKEDDVFPAKYIHLEK